jgi:hypothetical protein
MDSTTMDSTTMDENDIYLPIEPLFYSYKALDELYNNPIDYMNINMNAIQNVNICPYQVNMTGKFPFLQFLLLNIFEELSFITVPKMDIKKDDIFLEYSRSYLQNLLKYKDDSIHDESIEYKGFFIKNNELFLFFDITKCNFVVEDIYKNSAFWFALSDEIVNKQMVSGLHIHDDVTTFFSLNPSFLFLYDKTDLKYEIPYVAYVSVAENKINFTSIFGITAKDAKDVNAIFGQYYYFTNYENCIKNVYNNKQYENENKIGLMRIALFLEKTKIVENLQTDEVDNSNVKRERLNDMSLDHHYEKQTLRISDHNGNWTNNYESIILSDLRLDDGSITKDTPIICIKTYEQQTMLSFHFIRRAKYVKESQWLGIM